MFVGAGAQWNSSQLSSSDPRGARRLRSCSSRRFSFPATCRRRPSSRWIMRWRWRDGVAPLPFTSSMSSSGRFAGAGGPFRGRTGSGMRTGSATAAADRSSPQLSISSAVHVGEPAAEIVKAAATLRSQFGCARHAWPERMEAPGHGQRGGAGGAGAPCPGRGPGAAASLCRRPRRGPPPWKLPSRFRRRPLPRCSPRRRRILPSVSPTVRGKITLVQIVALGGGSDDVDHPRVDSEEKIETARRAAARALAALQRQHVATLDDGAEVRTGSPLVDVPDFAQAGDFDLIICATDGYTGTQRTLLEGVTEGILRERRARSCGSVASLPDQAPPLPLISPPSIRNPIATR